MGWWGFTGSSVVGPGLGKQQLGNLSQGVAAQGSSVSFWPKASTKTTVSSTNKPGKSSFLLDGTFCLFNSIRN
jgi:hypothetical protein